MDASSGKNNQVRYYHWVDPGVVIGREGGSVACVNLNGYLVKAPPEVVRPTSQDEELTIIEVDAILKRTHYNFVNSQDVQFEDVGEQY